MNLSLSSSARLARNARAAVALSLALALFLTTLAPVVLAVVPAESPTEENEHFLIYQAENGDVACREATLEEGRQLDKIVPKNLQQINHIGDNLLAQSTENDVQHLTIILNATAHLNAAPDAKAAFLRAAAA